MNPIRFSQIRPGRARSSGVALVLVLAFIVLVTGVVVAFFSRAMSERQLSNAGANEVKVDVLAQGAIDTIITDFKQEIVDGSIKPAPTPAPGVTLYIPATGTNSIPVRETGLQGQVGLENLIKRSSKIPTGKSAGAAGPVTTVPALNGRYITPARWNAPLLLAKSNTNSDTDFSPVGTVGSGTSASWQFTPEWVLVKRDETPGAPTTTWDKTIHTVRGTNPVVGRYAYAVYDEGGLLDINAAGYPSNLTTTQNKTSLAFADLKQLPGINSLTVATQDKVRDALVGFRNFASAAYDIASGTQTAPISGAFPSYAWSTANASNYYKYVLSNTTGFLKTANVPFVLATANGATNRVTDHLFLSRQEFLRATLQYIAGNTADRAKLQNAMPYLTTFARDINQPSFIKPQSVDQNKLGYVANAPKILSAAQGGNNATGLDSAINPAFITVRVKSTVSAARADGTDLKAGEPLVKKRFALSRLAWITWEGPSSTASATTQSNLRNSGVSQYLISLGNDANIEKYFGLQWDTAQKVWKYVHGRNGTSGPIMKLDYPADNTDVVRANREPDFFELLKASLNVGSLGKTLVNSQTALPAPTGAIQAEVPENYYYPIQSSVDYHIIQIGANIIDQADTDGYPTRIIFNDASSLGAREFQGVENMPYLCMVLNGALQVVAPSPTQGDSNGNPVLTADQTNGILTAPGLGAYMQLPVIWNPHDMNSSMGSPRPTFFRAVMDSTTPDNAQDGGNSSYRKFFVYAASERVVQQGIYASVQSRTPIGALNNPEYSYNADSSPTTNPGAGSLTYTGPADGSTLARSIYGNISALTFQVPTGNQALFREPTVLMRAGAPADSNLALDPGHLLLHDSAIGARATSQGVLSAYADQARLPDSSLDPANSPFVGFYLGAYPLRWTKRGADNQMYTITSSAGGAYLGRYNQGTTGGVSEADYFTYRLQFSSNANGPWITYDTKYGQTSGGNAVTVAIGQGGLINGYSNRFYPGGGGGFGYYASVADPRTSRFGLFRQACNAGDGFGKAINARLWNRDDTRTSPGWVDAANRVLLTISPDGNAGWFFSGYDAYKTAARAAGWNINTFAQTTWTGSPLVMKPGLLQQNNTDVQSFQSKFYDDGQGGAGNGGSGYYYADPDGVVRRAMGAWVPPGTQSSPTYDNIRNPAGDTTVGLPLSRATAFAGTVGVPGPTRFAPTIQPDPNITASNYTYQAQSRPYILNRPFRTVAELGYVFRDTPWKNLDFFTPESGDASLVDVFCVNDTSDATGLVAGKVNLNTRQKPVIQAILAAALLDDAQVLANTPASTLDPTVSGTIATALINYTSGTAFTNMSELVGKWSDPKSIVPIVAGDPNLGSPYLDGKLSYTGFAGNWDSANRKPKISSPPADLVSAYDSVYPSNSKHNGLKESVTYIQRLHEAPIRALTATAQARVWNLMIDVIAQSGRYPQTAAGPKDFVVEGEQRYWVHVAIDRLTGEVIDKQVEVVKE